MVAPWNMIDTSASPQPEAREYQTTCVGKRRRISKVSISLNDAAAARLRDRVCCRKNSAVELDTNVEKTAPDSDLTPGLEIAPEPLSYPESAASRVLHNFDLFEVILLQLPWAGHSPQAQRQSIRTIMTASRTCRSFHQMTAASARLQKRLFLARDPDRRRPCHCGSPDEDLRCATETNPFLAPLLHKHILHNSLSCEHRRHKQAAAHLARLHQKSLRRRRQSRAGPSPDTPPPSAHHDTVFRDLQPAGKKHVLAFQVSENDAFYLLGERSGPHDSWRDMYLTNPAPTRIEIYYWSYMIRAEAKDGGLTAGDVWDVVDETLGVARMRKMPGYQLEGDEPLLVLVGSWPDDADDKHVFDWLNQRHVACGKPSCRYLRS